MPPAKKSAPVEGPVRTILITGSETARKTAEANALLKANTDPDFHDFDAELLDGAHSGGDAGRDEPEAAGAGGQVAGDEEV